jgi:hypothetical protein
MQLIHTNGDRASENTSMLGRASRPPENIFTPSALA